MQLLSKIGLPGKKGYSFWVIVLVVFVYFVSDFTHHKWMKDEPPNRGVIKHDVKGYYGYLPAVFIYGDHTMQFMNEPGFRNDSRFLVLPVAKGKRLIQYTSGLAILYTPFFLTAHALAPLFGEERDGYNWVYQFFLVMSALFYVSLGLVFLRKLLLSYYDDWITALTLIMIALGTNLFYYTVYEGPMPHSYSFALISMFLFVVDRWYMQPTLVRSAVLGFLFGMVVLIRPSNGLVVFLLLFWGVTGWESLRERVIFLLGKTPFILLMFVFFLIPWIPQLLYWKSVTGEYFYNSYQSVGSAFYFNAPQTHKMLFSYRKGWFVYTPIMFFGVLGIASLYKNNRKVFWSVVVYMSAMIYVMSSWWSWWFGGSFGSRAMVDTYGVMAFPLAGLVYSLAKKKQKYVHYTAIGLLAILLGLQWMQTAQYNKGSIHYVAMDKDAYWHHFFKIRHRGVWPYLSDPDHILARMGIYYYYDWNEDNTIKIS